MSLLRECLCGGTDGQSEVVHGINCVRCSCGVTRQVVDLDTTGLAAWYRDEYYVKHYSHSREHDLEVAKKRLDHYGLTFDSKVLDVGCGNGAFIEAARKRGIEAWGQDVSASSLGDHAYVGELTDVAFPTDSFDVVTVHDVLEHLIDPAAALKELRRVLRRPGKLIVDFPRFWHEEGAHHWKPIEHLWMLTEDQLVALIAAAGFRVTSTSNPIPSKVVVEAEPLPESRPQVLVPSGIGDSYWVLTKLPGFLRQRGLGMPDVWVQDSGGPKRTQPYLRNVPFINAPGYKEVDGRNRIFREAYMANGRTVFPNSLGVDWFIAYNGVMRAGRSLTEVDPEFGCDWHPKLHVSKSTQLMKERMAGPGRYVLAYWAEAGMYRYWLRDFSAEHICTTLRMIQKELDCRIVFMGAPWDKGQVGKEIADMDPSFEDLIGATSFDQMLGCILGATAVVGFPAGNTMLAAIMGVPTVLLWNQYFHQNFWTNACPPDSNYVALDTAGLQPQALLNAVRERIEAGNGALAAAAR